MSDRHKTRMRQVRRPVARPHEHQPAPRPADQQQHAVAAYRQALRTGGTSSPAALMALQRTVGNTAVNQLLRQQVLQRAAGIVIQREISEDTFIDDTTSSILWCIKWRAGSQGDLDSIQQKLRDYENAEGAVAQVQRLDELVETARGIKAERGSKLQRALTKIISESQQVRYDLTQEKEYIEYEEGATKKKEEEKEHREKELLGLPYSDASPEARDARLEEFRKSFPKPAYVEGIVGTMSEEGALKALLANFAKRTDFSYIFTSGPWFSGRGDCGTLVSEYIDIAQRALGIKLGRASLDETHMFIEGGGKIIHTDEQTGSIDKGAHWYFTSHVWALWNGTPIDVLFGLFGALKKAVIGTLDVETVTWTFGGTKMYKKHSDWAPSEFDRYTLDPVKARPKAL